jgi:hypothetical protein
MAKAKKDTRRRILNPDTGRKVFMTGVTGRAIQKKKNNGKKNGKKKEVPKKSTPAKKPKIKATSATKAKSERKKKLCENGRCSWTATKKGGPVPGKWYGDAGATKYQSPLIKTAGKTKNFSTRPSARALFDSGYHGTVEYNNTKHKMAFRSNGSPYWKPIR